jgi:hypothetical protein
VYEIEAADVVVPGCLLLILAWAGVLMWRSTKLQRGLLGVALVPLVVASALVLLQMAVDCGTTVAITTMYICLAAVVLPYAIMVRHELARVIHAVLPIARLMRRRRRQVRPRISE